MLLSFLAQEPPSGCSILHAVKTNAAIATLCSLLATTLDFAGLLVKLATSHLLLQPASLNQLAESSYRLLNRLTIADLQLNHAT